LRALRRTCNQVSISDCCGNLFSGSVALWRSTPEKSGNRKCSSQYEHGRVDAQSDGATTETEQSESDQAINDGINSYHDEQEIVPTRMNTPYRGRDNETGELQKYQEIAIQKVAKWRY
jgi:hypothetical protein